MEINLLSFIPLITQNKIFSTEAALKYFLIQALASICLLASIIVKLNFSLERFSPSTTIMGAALFSKLGAAPFHIWFPGVMEGLDWRCNITLITWQKIGPFILLSYLNIPLLFTIFVTLASVTSGAVGGFNQTSLRKLIAYSSINHLGWLTRALLLGVNFWALYFVIYTLLRITVVLSFLLFNLNHLNQTFLLNTNKLIKLVIALNIFSLGGLPPFLGFYPKWILIHKLINLQLSIIVYIIVLASLITLYFYLRVAFAGVLLTHIEPKSLFKTLGPIAPLFILSSFTLAGLITRPFLFTLM